MDDQGTETFFSGFIKRSKYNSVLEKKSSPMIPHVSQVAQDQSEEDKYMLTSILCHAVGINKRKTCELEKREAVW